MKPFAHLKPRASLLAICGLLLAVVLPALPLTLRAQAPGHTDWNAGRDLALNEKPDGGAQELANPNATVPRWSYGYRTGIENTSLILYTPAEHVNVTDGFYAGVEGFSGGPRNAEGIIEYAVTVYPASHTNFTNLADDEIFTSIDNHSPDGNNVIRWTCPANGTYSYRVSWHDIDGGGGDGAAGYVVINGVQKFKGVWLNGDGQGAATSGTVALKVGDVFDVLLNSNSTDSSYDSTGTRIVITPGSLSDAVTVTVPGTSNLWLAGAAPGTTASSGQDNLSNATPFQVPNLILTPGQTMTFSATGNVSNDPANPATVGPDGGSYLGFTFYRHEKENGIANVTVPVNSLIGVFLNDSTPNPVIPPDGIDYSQGPGIDFTLTAPSLLKPFFIGDGKNSEGTVQKFYIPPGATRLFLGSMDPSENENNTGAFVVNINGGANPPPPPNNGLVVPGTANPFLAGLLDGTTASGGDDSAPAQSPVFVPGLTLNPNRPLNFAVIGSVSTDAALPPTTGPDGAYFFAHNAENGFPKIIAPLNSLVGVFLSDTAPDPASVNGTVRDFSDATSGGVNYLGYQPKLAEAFFIGDGQTSGGALQNVYPPAGATRLFLGVLDGNDYFNNLGQFNVVVTQSALDASDVRLGQSVSSPTSDNGSSALIGDKITYTFHLKNVGTRTLTNVVVRDVLPGVLEPVSISDGGTFQGGVVTWKLGSLAPTGSSTSKDLTLVVKTFAAGDSGQNVAAAQINQVVNNLNYSFTGDGLPPAISGLDLNNTTVLQAPVDVAITSNSASVTPGGTVTYTVTLKNNANATLKKPMVTLALPAGVKFDEASYVDKKGSPVALTTTDGVNFTSTAGSFTLNGGQLAIFSAGNLKPGESEQLILTVQVPYDVPPAAAIKFGSAKLTTKTSDGNGQNSYGVIVPDTKLSAAAVTQLPVLSLSKGTVDPYSLAGLFLFDTKSAKSLAKAFPTFPFYKPDPFNPSQQVINPDALLDLGQTLNPYIGEDPEGGADGKGILTITAPDAKKAPVTYATFALVYTNDGNVDTDKVVLNDPIPDGFAYDPVGLPTDPSINPIPAPFVLINGKPATADNFQVRADGRALIFSLGKAKMGKSTLIVYQLRVTGGSVGQTIQVPRAALTTNSLNATTYSDTGRGESLEIVGSKSYALEPQNNGNYTRVGDQVNFDLYYTNTGVTKYKDFLVACQAPSGVTFAGSALLAANGHDVSAAGPAPDGNGRIVFHLGKLKPGAGGFVRVSYTLGAALRTADKPRVVNAWVAAEADDNGGFPLAAHRLLTRAARAKPGTRDAAGTAGNPVALGITDVLDATLPRLFIAEMAPLAAEPGKRFDYLIAIGNLADVAAGVDAGGAPVTVTATLPPEASFDRLYSTDADNSSLRISGANNNVATFQIPRIRPHQVTFTSLSVKPGASSVGKSLSSSTQVSASFVPLLNAGPTATRIVEASQLALQRDSIASEAAQAVKVHGNLLPNLGKQITFGSNIVVYNRADAVQFNNGAVLIPTGHGAAMIFGNTTTAGYSDSPDHTLVSANGGVMSLDLASNLKVRNLADNAQRPVVGDAGITGEQIINDLYTASPNNLVRKSAATPVNLGGLNLYGENGNSFLNNQPNTAPQTINHAMTLGLKGAVIPAGLANSALADLGVLKIDRLISQDGSGLISQDGSGLISQDGSGLISQDGSGLISQDGSGLISQDGSGLVMSGGGNLVGASGAKLVAAGAGNAVGTPPGSTLVAAGAGNLVAAGAGNLVAAGAGN